MSPPTPSLVPDSCEFCHKTTGLLRCAGCKTILYCSQAHQLAHRSEHKSDCHAVKKALLRVVKEEKALRNATFGPFNPSASIFTEGVGQFSDYAETLPYVEAREALVRILFERFGRLGASKRVLVKVLKHCLELIRLDPTYPPENDFIRSLVPGLLLRLGRDSEAYRYIMQFLSGSNLSSPSGVNQHQSYPGTDHSNFLEPLDFRSMDALGWTLQTDECDSFLSVLSALMLLKVRILLDLTNIQNATRALGGFILPEILDIVRHHLVGSALQSRRDILLQTPEQAGAVIDNIKFEIRDIFQTTNNSNAQFWWVMTLGEDRALAEDRESLLDGSFDIARHHAKWSIDSWTETPGALEIMHYIVFKLPVHIFYR